MLRAEEEKETLGWFGNFWEVGRRQQCHARPPPLQPGALPPRLRGETPRGSSASHPGAGGICFVYPLSADSLLGWAQPLCTHAPGAAPGQG